MGERSCLLMMVVLIINLLHTIPVAAESKELLLGMEPKTVTVAPQGLYRLVISITNPTERRQAYDAAIWHGISPEFTDDWPRELFVPSLMSEPQTVPQSRVLCDSIVAVCGFRWRGYIPASETIYLEIAGIAPTHDTIDGLVKTVMTKVVLQTESRQTTIGTLAIPMQP